MKQTCKTFFRFVTQYLAGHKRNLFINKMYSSPERLIRVARSNKIYSPDNFTNFPHISLDKILTKFPQNVLIYIQTDLEKQKQN